jgi:outer membrane protein assembly factor BamB
VGVLGRSNLHHPGVVAGDLVLVTTDGGQLVAVSRTEGTEVWRVELGEVIRTRPVVANDLVLIATARGEFIAIAAPAEVNRRKHNPSVHSLT